MNRRFSAFALSGLLGITLASVAVVSAAPAIADTQICDQYGSTSIQDGRYIVQNNRWGTSATQCINVTSTGFSVTQADGSAATNGAPKSYPSVFYGCHWGNCSGTDNLLSPNGLRASDSRFRGISTSVTMTYPSSGTWDAAYDIWFNKSQPSTSTGQNDGAEVMVWLNHRGSIQPVGSKVGTASLAGATWDVWFGNIGWNVVSYVRQSATSSASFNVSTFWDDVVSRGYGSQSWYLTSIQAGFEPWESGVGLAVTDFSVSSTPNPTDMIAPTTPGTPSVSSITSSSASLAWSASTDNVGVTGYTVRNASTGAVLATTTSPSATLSGLSASTSYTVNVVARDAAGNTSTASSSRTFSTSGVTAGACTAVLTVVNSWPDGFQAEVKVTAGSSAMNGWTTAFTLPSGTSISNLWSGKLTTSGSAATVVNADWNGQVGTGQSTTYGFVVAGRAAPGSVTCAVR